MLLAACVAINLFHFAYVQLHVNDRDSLARPTAAQCAIEFRLKITARNGGQPVRTNSRHNEFPVRTNPMIRVRLRVSLQNF